jgi:hypothetical protein
VVVRLPVDDPGAARVTLTPADLRTLGHEPGEQGIASTIRAVVDERDALRTALNEAARRLFGQDGTAPHVHDHEVLARLDDVLVERAALRAEVERLRAEVAQAASVERQRCIAIARGCVDYMGGHSGRNLEVYHHGIETVANVLAADQSSFQVRVVEAIGRAKGEVSDG